MHKCLRFVYTRSDQKLRLRVWNPFSFVCYTENSGVWLFKYMPSIHAESFSYPLHTAFVGG